MERTGKIYGINGPVITIKGDVGFSMGEMVYAGEERLIGEVISLTKEFTTIQVYEETSGMKPGEIITGTGATLSVTLAPGILNNIFDGIERPLSEVAKVSGDFISRGFAVDSLDVHKEWDTTMVVSHSLCTSRESTAKPLLIKSPDTFATSERGRSIPSKILLRMPGASVTDSVAPVPVMISPGFIPEVSSYTWIVVNSFVREITSPISRSSPA